MQKQRNKARVQAVVDHTECEECLTDYMFLMKDNYHVFFLPVDEMFVAMQMASNAGVIPPLPEEWKYDMYLAHYTIIEDDNK